MELRDYQEETLFHLINSQLERECICLPTGAGKTVIFSTYAGIQAIEGKKTLICVNRQEILNQTVKAIYSNYGKMPSVINAKSKSLGINEIYIAMIETLHNRKKHLEFLAENIDTLIIDECHIGSFHKILKHGWKKIIGFSATPIYVKKGDCLKNYYTNIYEPINISKLIENDFLVKPTYFVPSNKLLTQSDRSELKLNTAKTDYDERAMGNLLSKQKFTDVIVKYVEKLAVNKRTIIYNSSVEHSIRIMSTLRQNGYNAYHVDGNTPEPERKMILSRLFTDSDCIVCNVNILTFGFDCPEVEVIIINRLTLSIALYHQMCGRGARKSTLIQKDEFIIADMFSNFEAHGTWNSDVNWELLFEKSKNIDGDSIAPQKSCPECDRLLPISTIICPECGHEFKRIEAVEVSEIDPQLMKLEEAKKNLNYIIDRVKQNGNNPYRSLHLIKEKIYNENKKSTLDELQNIILAVLPEWCKANNKKNNQWNKDFVKQIMKEYYESKHI